MKVIGALFRLSKFFWAPLLWAAVISVFLFCAGRQRLDLLGAVSGAYSDGSSWDRVFRRGVYPELGSMMENDKKAARA